MRLQRRPIRLALVPILLAFPLAVLAQAEDTAPLTSGNDRLFLAFAEDAAIVGNQWWEAQLEYVDGELIDAFLLRGVVAFQPWKRVELGARAGFGNSDTPLPELDGTGATDLDGWVKYHLGSRGDATEFAVGGLVTVPTGDDGAGLGFDSFGVELFGGLRHLFDQAILSAHAGVRLNGDGQIFGADLEGEVSPIVGFGLIYPRSDRITLVGEARFEGERFEGGDSDLRVLGGINWRPFNRGSVRGALSLGLTDGAPDAQLIVGYAFSF